MDEIRKNTNKGYNRTFSNTQRVRVTVPRLVQLHGYFSRYVRGYCEDLVGLMNNIDVLDWSLPSNDVFMTVTQES